MKPTRSQKASLRHALLHLTSNRIADADYAGYGGWSQGPRKAFIRRHRQAINYIRALLAEGVAQ